MPIKKYNSTLKKGAFKVKGKEVIAPLDIAFYTAKLNDLLEQTNTPKVSFTQEQVNQLIVLVDMLNTWNGALNLTAIKDVDEILILHIVDSAVLSPVINEVISNLPYYSQDKTQISIADVGTGAGFPGLVLAILNPHIQFTLIDSVGKKLSFVRQVVSKLQIKNVELINQRCEEIEHEPFDLIVSRAFAPLDRMINWCLPLLKEQGRFVAMKANLETEEKQAVNNDIEFEEIIELKVPTLDAKRIAVVLKRQA